MLDLTPHKRKLKELASKLFQKNKYERSLNEYLALSLEHPKDMRIRLKIAETYFRAKDIENAIRFYYEVAAVYIEENFILKAVALYKNILKMNPALVEVNLKLAELYHKIGMLSDAVNQYRIAMQYFESHAEKNQLIEVVKKLVEIDPSVINRRKLGEVYQAHKMIDEAMEQYDLLAREYRLKKQYDDLLRVLELMLPHKPKNYPLIRDICILYLRRQEPQKALRTMEHYQVEAEPDFASLFEKATIMNEALKKQGKKDLMPR